MRCAKAARANRLGGLWRRRDGAVVGPLERSAELSESSLQATNACFGLTLVSYMPLDNSACEAQTFAFSAQHPSLEAAATGFEFRSSCAVAR